MWWIELTKIAGAAFAAVSVFVFGQIVQRIFIEPIQDQRRTVGKIAHALTFYANAGAKVSMGTDREKAAEMVDALRGLASDLRASRHSIPFYRKLALVHAVEQYDAVYQASKELVGWSNNVAAGQDGEINREAIAKLLKIDRYGE